MESIIIKPLSVLIIEDDPGDREMMHKLLLQSPLSISEVQFADCLNAALELLENSLFDVIFLDLGLPESSGIESVNKVNVKVPNIPIVVLSGIEDAEMELEAVRIGVEDYLVKWQFDTNLLARTVRYAIGRKCTKNIIFETRKNINAIFDAAPVGMMLIDENTIVKRVNNAIRQMLNKDYLQIINQRFGDALGCIKTVSSGKGCGNSPACELCKLHKAVDTILESQQPVNEVEIRPTFKVGKERITRWFRLSGQPAVLDGYLHAVIAVNDITERKMAEKALQESEERYRSIFEQAADSIVLFEVDTGQIVEINKKAHENLGYSREEFLKLRIHDVDAIESEEDFKERVEKIFREGSDRFETRQITKSGEIRDVYVNAKVVSINGRNMIQGVWTDITERKKAERDRQLAEDKYKSIFENSAISISLADENERLISWNKFTENLLGMTAEDLYLKPIKSLYPRKEWEKIRSQNIREKGMQHHLETQVIRKDGELIDVDISLSVLKSPEGRVMGSIGVISDITERKEAERYLKETMAEKTQFISTVSHELRTPLASMKEAVGLVLDEVAGEINDEQKNFLDIAQRNIERLARLINDFLDFQKLSVNKMRFNMQQNDIREVIEDAYETMSPYANKKGINLCVQFDGDLPRVRFDSDRIIQVLTNLMSNAIKFTPENGRVDVHAWREDENLVIQVGDTGMGMPEEALPRIFEQFYRANKTDQKVKGTGLGLSIVKKIIDVHRGRIEVKSKVNEGTTFAVYLPVSGGAAAESEPDEPAQAEQVSDSEKSHNE